jgi:hypothetical protein
MRKLSALFLVCLAVSIFGASASFAFDRKLQYIQKCHIGYLKEADCKAVLRENAEAFAEQFCSRDQPLTKWTRVKGYAADCGWLPYRHCTADYVAECNW